jgi:hypothetical protein
MPNLKEALKNAISTGNTQFAIEIIYIIYKNILEHEVEDSFILAVEKGNYEVFEVFEHAYCNAYNNAYKNIGYFDGTLQIDGEIHVVDNITQSEFSLINNAIEVSLDNGHLKIYKYLVDEYRFHYYY